MKNLLSVIVPVYNVNNYLERCINSILEQNYQNMEIILVDDGSTDGSSIICDNYSKRYENIKVIHKQNGGLSSARNTGIDNCSGRYISFIDSDDWIDKEMFSEMIAQLEADNSDIVICRR